MILSFGNKDTEKIWHGETIRGLSLSLQENARRKLRMLNNSIGLNDLTLPPSNRLKKLKGTLREFYSIRLNDQWRLIFKWEDGNAREVEITDYH
ncbi:MAG: type II toxin-antitoxin system RelE/ParE family toxin [Ignavibacteria bacterium]|nr:type II toxin-antitoxin system RelE/ParE family toxin [Ignavibacteria bacterium]